MRNILFTKEEGYYYSGVLCRKTEQCVGKFVSWGTCNTGTTTAIIEDEDGYVYNIDTNRIQFINNKLKFKIMLNGIDMDENKEESVDMVDFETYTFKYFKQLRNTFKTLEEASEFSGIKVKTLSSKMIKLGIPWKGKNNI
jgi:hypothetical protein